MGKEVRMAHLPSQGLGLRGCVHLTTLASAQAHPASHTGLPVTGEEPSSSVHAEEPLGSLGSAGKDSRVSADTQALLVAFLPNIKVREAPRHLRFCLFTYTMLLLLLFSLLLDTLRNRRAVNLHFRARVPVSPVLAWVTSLNLRFLICNQSINI